MKAKAKKNDGDEHELLINRKAHAYDGDSHHHNHPLHLEWAEISWTRWPSVLCWWWVYPILSICSKRTITDNDLDDLPHEDKCATLHEKLNNYDQTQMTTLKVIVATCWKQIVLYGFLLLPVLITRLAQPLILRQIVLHIESRQNSSTTTSTSVSVGYIYPVALFISMVIQAFLHHQIIFRSYRLGLMVRNLVTSMIYTRLLSINTSLLQQLTSANAINLVASDATKFDEFFIYVHYLWEAPLEAALVFGILCWTIGPWASLSGYIIFFLMIPLQILFSRQFSRYRGITATHADSRLHSFEELINGCQVIKIYNWEKSLEERVLRMRELELASIRRASHVRALNMSLYFASVPLIGFALFAGAYFSGRLLKASEIFMALAFFCQMRPPVTSFLPIAIEKVSDIRIALQRIDAFMKLTIKCQWQQQKKQKPPMPDMNLPEEKGALILHDASFSWNDHGNCLSSLNINIEPGTFVGIKGPVGSGKSSLFAAFLGEMTQTGGQTYVNGSFFSYAAQSPWIYADTLRANILLGKAFDKQRYAHVLRACCLDVDLSMIGPSGDSTVIGEKGVNLSGGQRARLSLARALYADADIYLLDDPLAAVDGTVAKRIYDRCIGPHGLLSRKTRILITHQTQFLTESHQTIFLTNGRIQTLDPADESVVKHESIDRTDNRIDDDEPLSVSMLDIEQPTADANSIIADETATYQSTSWSTCYALFTAPPLRSFGLYLLIALLMIGEILYDGINVWLAVWYKDNRSDEQQHLTIVCIYFALVMAILVLGVIRAVYFFHQILNGTNDLHNRMLSGVLYTSMRFFESNPSGRILNRASKDQQIIDELLPVAMFDAIQLLLLIAGSIIIVVCIYPWLVILVVVLLSVFWILRRFYVRSSRQLKHLESQTRSPVYALFTSTLNGLATIRAFRVKDDFIQLFTDRIDANTRASLIMKSASQWFGFRIDLMVALFSFATAVFVIMTLGKTNLALVALALMNTISMGGALQWGTRQSAEAENYMTSVERIEEYAQLPREEDEGGSKKVIQTPPDWPGSGEIEFHNYSLRYRSNLEPALKNITLSIISGEKVGVIGRTGIYEFLISSPYVTHISFRLGAGKSSVFQGLLRLVDRSNINGVILIDGIDISRVTLSHLRSHLSVIPQQSALFNGSLRYNIDPFNTYSDEQCWTALEAVQLKQMASEHPSGIQMHIDGSGSNLSVGQRQLVCIARAILKQSRILLIDEATANIDEETDRLIQSIIAERFQNRTVLTIAHRLNTVIDSDRLVMLDKGMVVGFDVPHKVLPNFA